MTILYLIIGAVVGAVAMACFRCGKSADNLQVMKRICDNCPLKKQKREMLMWDLNYWPQDDLKRASVKRNQN